MGMKGKVSKGTSKEKEQRQPIRKLEDVIVRVENYCFLLTLFSLKYVCHGPCRTYLVIISSRLSCDQELSLLEILKMHKSAIGWSIDDIHGISKDM
ncbi:unnamed protein product [Spirodela intermedia]|uniref:Uncharacterized protein n=1 Tax=Spirodela intermedia TaxID=51605 RepID=A0ABN7EEB9_SPIIN|nr:unnamed protein product [Spirodela intermedia]